MNWEAFIHGIVYAGIPFIFLAAYFLIRDEVHERRARKAKAEKKARKKEKKRLKALAAG